MGEPFARGLAQQLPAPYQAVVDDIAADLQNIVLSRVVAGVGLNLFDRLWEVYRQGGWPCGWEGAFPAGRLVAFQPPANP